MFKLFKPIWLAIMLALTVSIFAPISICAVDTSTATYTLVIRVSNNGTTNAYNVSVPVTINTAFLVNNGYMGANFSDTAVLDNYGNATAYCPGIMANTTFMVFVPYIPASSNFDYRLYLGGRHDMAGNLSLIPGATTGLTTADSASMELGNNFSITQTGFLDTTFQPGKNLTAKTGALVVNVTAAGNVTVTYAGMRSIDLYAYTYEELQGASGYTRAAQRITDFPSGTTITNVSLMLGRYNAPTGTATVNLRRSSDDAVLATMGTINVSTIIAGEFDNWYTFNNTVLVNETDIRLSVEYSGGNITNKLEVGCAAATVPNETLEHYSGSWSVWNGYELNYRINASNTQSKASNVDIGKHNFFITGNSTGIYTLVDGVLRGSSKFSPIIPNNTAAWSFAQNQCWTYLESQSVMVNGVEVQNISWQNAAVWVDGSGNGNNATPSFRTTSTHPNVSAVALDFQVEHESILTEWDPFGGYTGDAPVPGMPSQMYDQMNATFPGHGIIDDVEAASDTPPGTLWFMIPALFVLLAGMFTHDKTKSLGAQVGVMLVMMIFISLAHVWALWMIIPFGLIASACLVGNKVVAI